MTHPAISPYHGWTGAGKWLWLEGENMHTKGPWIVDETNALGAYGVWTDYVTHPGSDGEGYGSQICSMLPSERQDREQRDADARLISAAPELLEICKRLVDANVDTPGEIIREAQKVILKATGEPQP